MKRFRKRRAMDLGTYVAPDELPETPLDDLIDEGVLISAAGVRLAVKNLMIIKSIRDGLDYDLDRYRAAVSEELLNLAHEKDADADRIRATHDAALSLAGRPSHHADYRSVDSHQLHRREEVSRGLARRLRELSGDEEWGASLVQTARTAALEEIAASVSSTLLSTRIVDDDAYRADRPNRLRLLADDLLTLQTTPPDDRDW